MVTAIRIFDLSELYMIHYIARVCVRACVYVYLNTVASAGDSIVLQNEATKNQYHLARALVRAALRSPGNHEATSVWMDVDHHVEVVDIKQQLPAGARPVKIHEVCVPCGRQRQLPRPSAWKKGLWPRSSADKTT